LGGAEQPLELVWGIGLARWNKDGFEVDLPLLERLVEIEIDEGAGGEIRLRPRSAPANANLRPYEEMKVEGAPLALDAARRVIATSDTDDGVSPFLRDTFEPALRACQTRLDAEGRYGPDCSNSRRGVTSLRVRSLGNLRASAIREFFAERHCKPEEIR
jgi:hypothetical protein